MPATIDLAGPAAIAPGLDLGDTGGLGSLFLGLAVLIAIVALTHQRSRAFSPSVVYLGLGAAGAAGAALLDLGWLDLIDDADAVERLAELAVIVALFATGMRLDRPIGLRGWRSTILLLGGRHADHDRRRRGLRGAGDGPVGRAAIVARGRPGPDRPGAGRRPRRRAAR